MWHWRSACPTRHYPSGLIGPVRGHYYWREPATLEGKGPRKSKTNSCPYCHAKIHTVPTKNGGWAHFEHGLQHVGTLHSCFTVGRSIPKGSSGVIRDLFDEEEDGEA